MGFLKLHHVVVDPFGVDIETQKISLHSLSDHTLRHLFEHLNRARKAIFLEDRRRYRQAAKCASNMRERDGVDLRVAKAESCGKIPLIGLEKAEFNRTQDRW